jgi:hypothetical protein
MAEKVNWTFATRVLNGPTLARSGELPVEAYVKIAVTIPQGQTVDVEVFPGGGGSAQLLVVDPGSPSDKLTYKIGTTEVKLDGPHVLIGSGAVGLLAGSSGTIGTLKFKNQTAADAELSILAGRDATP